MYTNCTLLNEDIFLIGHIGGFPARMSSDEKIVYYDEMQGFVKNETTSVIDFLDNFQNKAYALDSKRGSLVIFDLENYKCRYIPLNCSPKSWMNFAALERYGSSYYIFPRHENKLLIFNTEKNQIIEERNYINYCDEIQCICRVKDEVWILPKDMAGIYCYHLSNGEKEVYRLEGKIEDCVHAFFDGEFIFFLNKYGVIYRWDIEKKNIQKITVFETEHNDKEAMSRIICAGGKLILLPAGGRDIKILNLLTKKTEIYADYPKDFCFQPDKYKFYGYCENELYYFFAQCFGNYFLKIEKSSGQLVWIKPTINLLGKRAIEFMGTNVIYEETLEIMDLLEADLPDKFQSDTSLIGKNIYHLMNI